jgi:hypothetical protein
MADIIIEKIYKKPVFTWGSANLLNNGSVLNQPKDKDRAAYLRAVKAADKGDFSQLLAFARS